MWNNTAFAKSFSLNGSGWRVGWGNRYIRANNLEGKKMILFVHGVGFVEVRDLSRKSQFFSQLLLFCVIFIFCSSAISLFYSDRRINMIVAYNISTIAIKMKCAFFLVSFKFQWFFFSREFIFQAHFKTFCICSHFFSKMKKKEKIICNFCYYLTYIEKRKQ